MILVANVHAAPLYVHSLKITMVHEWGTVDMRDMVCLPAPSPRSPPNLAPPLFTGCLRNSANDIKEDEVLVPLVCSSREAVLG